MSRMREMSERIAMALVVPSVGAPVAAQIGAAHSDDSVASLGVSSIVVSVFLFIAHGSMLVNVLLILRTPVTLATGRLDLATAIPLVGLDAVMLVWAGFLFAGDYGPGLVLSALTIVLSIVVCVFAVRRRRRAARDYALEAVRFPWWARALLLAFVLAAIGSVIAAPALDLQAELYEVVGSIAGDWQWVLLLLGLPWTYLAQLVLALIVTPLSMSSVMTSSYGSITSTTMIFSLAALANITFAVLLLARPRFRTRVVNRFFRLESVKTSGDQ